MTNNGTIVDAYPKNRDILGWTLEELAGKNAVDRVYPEDIQLIISRQGKLLNAPDQTMTR